MPSPLARPGSTARTLPPLILHPFNERVPPSALLENSKAALMLAGLIPSEGADPEDLRKRLLSGRYSEVRMLFFLGKDILRWIDQSLEWSSTVPELEPLGLNRQSFARLLVEGTPDPVREKLVRWGVADFKTVFSRGIALNTMFSAPPSFDVLADDFLRNYHRYADAVYASFLESEPRPRLPLPAFHFDLYASGEYTRLLESEWGES
jgi:hypothetical protein